MYQEKFVRYNVIAPLLLLSAVTVTLPGRASWTYVPKSWP